MKQLNKVRKPVKKAKSFKGTVSVLDNGEYMTQVVISKGYSLIATKSYKTTKGALNGMAKQLEKLNPKATITWEAK